MMTSEGILKEIAKLSSAQQILLLEEAWDTLCFKEENIAVPQWHKDALDKRLAEHEHADRNAYLSADEFHAQLRENL
ncbi:MAG: addiction module protein [Gammaproteobacteria bacterium]|nr:addiction module protein [Gammaproteobacteria bacterium]